MVSLDEDEKVRDSIDVAVDVGSIVHIHLINESSPCDCILLMVLDGLNQEVTALVLVIKNITNKEMVE